MASDDARPSVIKKDRDINESTTKYDARLLTEAVN